MTRRLLIAVAGLFWAVLIALLLLVLTAPKARDVGAPEERLERLQSEVLPAPFEALKKLAKPKAPPGPNDWLANQPERGQSLKEWRNGDPVKANAERRTLYLVKLGDFTADQARVFALTREYLGLHFGLPVEELDPLPASAVPEAQQRKHPVSGQLQWNSAWILEHLLPSALPKDGVAVMAFTATDLWPAEGWNFVFGEASVVDRVGVYSLARHGDPKTEWKKVLLRTIKVGAHEAGHMFSIQHCIAFECLMNGGNNLEESDHAPLEPCPVCLAKQQEATRSDLGRRLENVRAFLEREGLGKEAEAVKAEQAALN